MPQPTLWTYQEIAAVAKVHPRTVQRWVKRLNLEVFRPSLCTVRLPAASVESLLGRTEPYELHKTASDRPG